MKVGFFGTLFIVLLVLKLTATITWSWWWVTAPLWGGFALLATIFIFGVFCIVLSSLKKRTK